ncbi:MAG: 16S rRNA methyltransferase [Thermoplasmata archaeon]
MLTIILADSELETIPPEIWKDPAIVKYSRAKQKNPGNLLLDASYHHTAIKKIDPENVNRRGRPDIVHMFLLIGLESILNKEKMLRLYVHTRGDYVISVDPETRIPKNYNRFVGLMESLFLNKQVPDSKNPLLKLEKCSLPELTKKLGISPIIMHPDAAEARLSDLLNEDSAVIIGGFSEGDYRSDIRSIKNKCSIYPKELVGWVVEMEVIVNYERSVLKY